MSITKGAINASLYRIGNPVGSDGEQVCTVNNDFVIDRLKGFAFREREITSADPVWGFCDARNMLDVSFDDINDFILDRYALFGLRQDRKRVPTALFKAHLQKRVKAWCAENGRQRCPAAVRAELKELLEFEMLQRANTEVKSWQVLWNMVDGWLLFDNSALGTNEHFVKLFFESFGLVLRPVTPLDLPSDDMLRGRAILTGGIDYRPSETLRTIGIDGAEPLPVSTAEDSPVLPHLSSEFLLWLWYRTDVDSCKFEVPGIEKTFDMWSEGRVVMRARDEDTSATTVVGENPCVAPECRRAMEHGKLPSEMKLSLRSDDREFTFVLKSPELQPKSVSLPQVISGSDDEALYDRMFLYEELRSIISALFEQFLSKRVEPTWVTSEGAAIQKWLSDQDEQ